jgi:hypothetical protein
MSIRVWVLSLLASLLIFAAPGLGFTMERHGAPLRQQHSQPAANVPAVTVAVAAEGNAFHDPHCKYIHGKPELITAEEAVRRGYSPCVRCMRTALHQ